MKKKLLVGVALVGIVSSAFSGTTFAAETKNINNLHPTGGYVVDFQNDTEGELSTTGDTNIYGQLSWEKNPRNNLIKVTNVSKSGTAPKIVSGKFGKSTEDKSLYAQRTDTDASVDSAARLERGDSPNGTWFKGYSAGDTVVQSFMVALDKDTDDSYLFNLQMEGTVDGWNYNATTDESKYQRADAVYGNLNGSLSTVFQINKNVVSFFGSDIARGFNIIPEKWYKVDIVMTVGNGSTVKNNAKLYIDGKYLYSKDYSIKDSSAYNEMYGIIKTRFNMTDLENTYLNPDGTAVTGKGHYLDDVSLTAYAATDNYVYPEVTLEKTGRGADAYIGQGIVAVNGETTVADLKSVLTAGDYPISIVSAADGTELEDTANPDGALVKIAASNGDIFYKIGQTVTQHYEDYESTDAVADKAYLYWDSISTESDVSGTISTVKDFAGKSGKSIVLNNETNAQEVSTWRHCITLKKGSHKIRTDENIPLVVETMINPVQEHYVTTMLRLGYRLKTASGESTTEKNTIQISADKCINIGDSGLFAGYAKYGEWQKVVLVIDTATVTADVYINGVKKNEEPVVLIEDLPEGTTLAGIEGAYYRIWGSNSLKFSGYSAFDDFKISTGFYDAEKDAKAITSTDASVVVGDGYITVPAATKVSALMTKLNIGNNSTVKVYQNSQFATEYPAVMPLVTNAYLVETTAGGAIHYYKIIVDGSTNSYSVPEIRVDGVVADALPTLAEGEDAWISAFIKMDNVEPEAGKNKLIIAVYKLGALSSISMVDTTGKVGVEYQTAIIQDVSDLENVTVKAFLWDGTDSMCPLVDSNEL